MILTLQNFKGYVGVKRFDFSVGTTLLSGQSGIGKTTVLQAVKWCLYGKLRGVDSRTGNGKLSVSLTLTDITVKREKKPNVLTVTIADRKDNLIDDEAQDYVNKYFGDERMFESTSYIEQGKRNEILTVSSSEKLAILNKIAFGEEDPTVYIEKLTDMSSSLHKKVNESLNKVNMLKETYDTKYKNIKTIKQKIDVSTLISNSDDVRKLRDIVLKYENTLMTLKKERETLQKELDHWKETITDDDVDKLSSEISLITEKLKKETLVKEYRRGKDKCEKTSKNIDSSISTIIDKHSVSDDDIIRIKNALSSADRNGIVIDENTIKKLEDIIQKVKYQQYTKDFAKLDQILSLPGKLEKNDLTPIISDIEKCKIEMELLSCPACKTTLKYTNGNLKISDGVPRTAGELEELKKIKDRVVLCNNLYDAKLVLEKRLEGKHRVTISKDEKLPDKTQLTELEGLLQSVRKYPIEILNKKFVQMYENFKDYNHILQEFSKMTLSSSEDENLDFDKLRDQLTKLNTKLTTRRLLEKNIKRLTTSINDTESKISKLQSNIPSSKSSEELDSEWRKTLDQIETSKQSNEKLDLASLFKTSREECVLLTSKMKSIDHLREIAIDLQYRLLNDTVNQINRFICDVTQALFSDPITISLSLYRKLKTKKECKPEVNLTISYKGIEYDSVNQMSGGEGDRVSLALTIALNKLSRSPILMLDEVLSSVDNETKDDSVTCLSTLLSDKYVLSVDHGGTEGVYSSVVYFKKDE